MIEHIHRKPLYGNFLYIRKETLQKAIANGGKLKITIVGQGSAVVDAKDWVATGKKMSKVFLQPNNPMILYGNNVPVLNAPKGTVETTPLPAPKPKPIEPQTKLF